MYADRIFTFWKKFRGRLELTLLQGALDYVTYNEEGLAFEILCDYICDNNIKISDSEYEYAMTLAVDMGFDISSPPFKHLSSLK